MDGKVFLINALRRLALAERDGVRDIIAETTVLIFLRKKDES